MTLKQESICDYFCLQMMQSISKWSFPHIKWGLALGADISINHKATTSRHKANCLEKGLIYLHQSWLPSFLFWPSNKFSDITVILQMWENNENGRWAVSEREPCWIKNMENYFHLMSQSSLTSDSSWLFLHKEINSWTENHRELARGLVEICHTLTTDHLDAHIHQISTNKF